MTECHLLGNGLSIDLAPVTDPDITYGCNFNIPGRPVEALGVTDYLVLKHHLQHDTVEKIFLTQTLHKRARTENLIESPFNQYRSVLVEGGDLESRFRRDLSTGHLMAHFLSHRYKTIHLWGFDALFSGDISSWHDGLYVHDSKASDARDRWSELWMSLQRKMWETDFILHTYTGSPTDNPLLLKEIF